MTAMNYAAAASRFRAEAVSTATPATLLTMLYDRLVLDLDRGAAALDDGRREEANTHLQHAQSIVHELRASLALDSWEGAAGLAGLYGFLLTEIVGANIARDAGRVRSCRDLVIPLRDAWHEAARTAAGPGVRPAAGPADAGLGVLGVG